MDKLFFEQSKSIKIYLATETQLDPFEKNVSRSYLNPLPIKAIITDLVASQINWKMPGIIADKAKEIIIKKKYRNLIERSQKIEVNDELYEGWRLNGKMQIREEGNYLRIYIYMKHV